MTHLIHTNNQYLQNITSIPIKGLPAQVLKTEIIINDNAAIEDQEKMTVQDYFVSTDWCHGLEPTDTKGKYLLVTTKSQLSEAHTWLDNNLEDMFVEYIPKYMTFQPIEGYEFPIRTNKPRFSNQLRTYADKLRAMATSNPNKPSTQQAWNRSPLKPNPSTHWNFIFEIEEYPALQPSKTKHTNTGATKPANGEQTMTAYLPQKPPLDAKALREQISADMKNDITKLISSKIGNLQTEFNVQVKTISETITKDINQKITEVLETIHIMNQRLTEVMDCLPQINTTMPAHKKSKGLGMPN